MKCESGALTCLNEIREQIESKRVLIFGLRSLVEYLSTRGRGSGQFVDNVLGCVEAGLTEVLADLYRRYGATDEDILLHLTKIVASVTKAFALAADQPGAAPLIQKSIDQGYEALLRDLVATACLRISLADAQFWQVIYDPLLVALNPLSPGSQAPQILKVSDEAVVALDARLAKEKKLNKHALSAAALLAHVKAATAPPPATFPLTLLACLQRNLFASQSAPLDVPFTTDILSCILHLLNARDEPQHAPDAVENVLSIMDIVPREKKSLQETLGRILGKLVGPQELEKCTEELVNEASSLKALQILSALSRVSGTTDLKKQMMDPVAKIIGSFTEPNDPAQFERFRSALAILQSFVESSSASAQTKELGQQLLRVLLLPDFPLTDDATDTVFSILCQLQAAGAVGFDSCPDEFYHTLTQVVAQADAAPSTVCQALRFAAGLAFKSEAATRKIVAANLPAAAEKRLTVAQKKPRDAVELVGAFGKLQEALLKDAPAEALSSLPIISNTLKLLTPEDRYAFEMVLPFLQRVSGLAKSDEAVFAKLTAADVATGVLKSSITFADYTHIVKACEAILRTSISGADLDRAVQTLAKLSKEPKANLQACEDACATIHGVATLSSGETLDLSTLDGLLKSLTHITAVPFFPGQCQLILHTLACIKALAPLISAGSAFKDEPHRLLAVAHSSGVRAIADSESAGQAKQTAGHGDSIVTEIIKCAAAVISLDHFDSESGFEKCVSDVGTLMRKYPEQRKTQIACIELLAALVSSSAFDVTPEFLKSGLCKQLLGTMSRGSAIQEYQAVGLRVILAVARRRPENPDGLRRAGVVDVLKMISEHYQAKPEILRLCQQAQALLMPQEQVRDEVLSQIESLEVAGRHRDVKSGAEALTALAGLTAAADAAKYAAKNGMGNAMNTFFDAMRASPAVPFAELETCSLGAVQTVRNVGNVGRPHSTLMLKSGALPLIQTILAEAVNSDSEIAGQVVAQCLEAGRCLLANEANPQNVVGVNEFSACLNDLLPQLLKKGDPKQTMGIVSAVGLLATEEHLTENAPLVKALPDLVAVLNNATSEEDRVEVLRCIYQMTGRRAKLVQRFAESGGCEAVIRCLDTYGGDEAKTAVWCRRVLERVVATIGDSDCLRAAMMKRGGSNAVEYAVKALGRNLGTANDLDTNSAMVGMLCKLTAQTDRRKLADLGIMETITTALELNGTENLQLKGMIGDLLTNLGGDEMIDQYFRKIVALCSAAKTQSAPGALSRKHLAVSELSETLKKLENFIFCTPTAIDTAFGSAPAAMTCLSEWLGHTDLELAIQTSQLMMNMSRRFREESLSPYGVQACIQSGYINRSIAQLVQPSSDLQKSPQFLANLYETLILSCSNESTYNTIFKLVEETNFLETTWALLYRYKNQEEVATPIIGFLGHFTRSVDAAELLEKSRKHATDGLRNVSGSSDDASTAIWNVIWNLRRNGQSVGSGLDALGMVARYNKRSKLFANKATLKQQIQELALQTPEACCGYAGFARCLMNEEDKPDAAGELDLLYDDLLEILVKQYYNIKDDDSVEREVRDRLLRRMAGVVESVARRGDYHLIRRSRVVACLADAAKSEMHRKQALQALVRATYFTREDKQSWSFLVGTVLPTIATTEALGEEVLNSQETSEMLIETALKLCLEDDDCKRALQEIPELLKLVTEIETLANEISAAELQTSAAQLRELLANKVAEKLTLEIVYKRWRCRVERQQGCASSAAGQEATDEAGYEILNLGSGASSELLSEVEFVARETLELSTHPQKSVASNPVAREFWFGCHCFTLLHMVTLNSKLLTSGVRGTKLQDWMITALSFQPAEESLQSICQGIHRGVTNASAEYAAVPKAAQTVVEAVRRSTNHTACQEGINSWRIAKVLDLGLGENFQSHNVESDLTAEKWLVERLSLMAAMCQTDRCFYNQTDALDVLKYIITLVQSQQAYSIETVKAVLKVLRAMANEQICDKFIELKFPEYLLGLVDAPESPRDLLADDLMVIGFMASFLKTKNYFGRLDGVQRIVQLLKRAEKDKSLSGSAQLALSRVQQNACLAVGNLVLGHPQNGTNFGKEGGVDLAVRIMNNSMMRKVDYDLANAVCVLISNASFKRDDFKEAFGNAEACIAILQCIKRYDGADCPSAHRCLSSMFKAVGNLALIPNNVQRFLDADIGKCLKAFYSQDSSSAEGRAPIPDDLLLVSLKTLSNLTLENAEAFMLHFGAILEPLVALISSGKHHSPELMAFVCDTFASLCRNAENRESFIRHHGIQKTIELVNQFKDERVYVKGLDLFGVLASYPNAAAIMADGGIFVFILGVLEECAELDALTVVAALRVIRRLVTDKKASAKFVEASPMQLLCECLKAAAPYADRSVPCSLTVKEICHIVLILLSTHAPEFPEAVADFSLVANTRDVPWADDILTGASSIAAKQFSRIFSRRAKSNGGPESDSSDGSEESPNASDDPSQASTSVEMHSVASSRAGEDSSYPEDEEAGSPVDLQTPLRKKESNLEIQSNVSRSESLNKPKGTRSYQEIGLDARTLIMMSRAIFLMLATGSNDSTEDGTLRQDKLSEYCLTILAYVVCEKVDGCGLIFCDSGTGAATAHSPECSDVSLLIEKIFAKTKEQRGPNKLRLVGIGADLISNACCVMDQADLVSIPANPRAIICLKSSSNALTRSAEAPIRRKIEDVWALFELGARNPELVKPSMFYELATYGFPLDVKELSTEEFANGVQDLPAKLRTKIRRGGKNKCLIREESGKYTLKPLWWKSSSDMLAIKFMTDKDKQNYDSQIVIGRARRIVRGASETELKAQLKNLKVKSRHIVTICGGESPAVHMVFSNRIKASRMYERIATWHAAATR